jgi:hypothetical protein
VIFLLTVPLPVSAFAPQNDADVQTSVEYQYGSLLSFKAEINSSSSRATRATLFYRLAGTDDTKSIEASLTGTTPQIALAEQDLRLTALPPFSQVAYWWQVDLDDGTSTTTVPTSFDYTDNRFDWQSLHSGNVTVHWVTGDTAFGQSALDIAHSAQASLERKVLPAGLPELDVYIYPTIEDLQAGLLLGGQSWTGGHAEPSLGVVLVSAVPSSEGLLSLERSLPHELTHVLLYQRMDGAYANLPPWLNEGLATLAEGDPDPSYRLALEDAARLGDFLPLTSLCAPFPSSSAAARLAYAESASIVRYIQDVYGSGAISALLDAYQEGSTSCTGGIQRVLRRSPDQLEAEWIRASFHGSEPLEVLRPFLPWLVLVLPIMVLVAVLALVPARRASDRRAPSSKSSRR